MRRTCGSMPRRLAVMLSRRDQLAHLGLAAGVTHHRRAATQDRDGLVPGARKVGHRHQGDVVPHMQAGGRGIEAGIKDHRPALSRAARAASSVICSTKPRCLRQTKGVRNLRHGHMLHDEGAGSGCGGLRGDDAVGNWNPPCNRLVQTRQSGKESICCRIPPPRCLVPDAGALGACRRRHRDAVASGGTGRMGRTAPLSRLREYLAGDLARGGRRGDGLLSAPAGGQPAACGTSTAPRPCGAIAWRASKNTSATLDERKTNCRKVGCKRKRIGPDRLLRRAPHRRTLRPPPLQARVEQVGPRAGHSRGPDQANGSWSVALPRATAGRGGPKRAQHATPPDRPKKSPGPVRTRA